MVRRSKRCMGSRRTRRHSSRHARHSTRSRRVRRVHSRHTRGRRIHDVKIGGVWGETKIVNSKKYMQNADGKWVLHPTELQHIHRLSEAFGNTDHNRGLSSRSVVR